MSNFKILHYLIDKRVDCYSILTEVKVNDYLQYVETAYKNKGGIEGQRAPLKTKTAQRIRSRMLNDLALGSVLPPVVLGIVISDLNVKSNENTYFDGLIENATPNWISIIDGMQRTTALKDYAKRDDFDKEATMRAEFWIAKNTNSLLYRMLVLNNGQIPWNLSRQMEVIFAQFAEELKQNDERLILSTTDNVTHRTKAGIYPIKEFMELFMHFGSKRLYLDTKEALAEEFARLDIINSSGSKAFNTIFLKVAKIFIDLDVAFSKLTDENTPSDTVELKQFNSGLKIFSSQPARAAFMTAFTQAIAGESGVEIDETRQAQHFEKIESSINAFIQQINGLDGDNLFDFIDLPTLEERITGGQRRAALGTFDRDLFFAAFKKLFRLFKENETIDALTPLWRVDLS